MTTEQALAFLRQHQPMLPEGELTQEMIEQYNASRLHFLVHPDSRCVPLFLGAFGEGTCYGVYQLMDEVLRMYPRDYVVSELAKALRNPHLSVRTWCLEMALSFPDAQLRPLAVELAASTDSDESLWAQYLLKMIDTETR